MNRSALDVEYVIGDVALAEDSFSSCELCGREWNLARLEQVPHMQASHRALDAFVHSRFRRRGADSSRRTWRSSSFGRHGFGRKVSHPAC